MANPAVDSFQLRPVLQSDINTLAKMSDDAFLKDRHTQMKMLGNNPYDMEEVTKQGLVAQLNFERCLCVKAVDEVTGEIMGWTCWGFRGFEREEILSLDLRTEEQRSTIINVSAEENNAGESKRESKQAVQEKLSGNETDDPISRLQDLTNADMERWMEIFMPPGTKCMYIVGLSVSPSYQGRGVGTALLKWGTGIADKFGVFAWVHSSDDEAAWKLYQKHGFEIAGILDVDLDEYAPAPPPIEEGEGAVWGRYVFRYMKRLPKGQ
jgi:ribosomal protein S18 acetylase RimI-like enzyme